MIRIIELPSCLTSLLKRQVLGAAVKKPFRILVYQSTWVIVPSPLPAMVPSGGHLVMLPVLVSVTHVGDPNGIGSALSQAHR